MRKTSAFYGLTILLSIQAVAQHGYSGYDSRDKYSHIVCGSRHVNSVRTVSSCSYASRFGCH